MSTAALPEGISRPYIPSPQARALARQIEHKCQQLDQQNPFELLGVSPTSTREQIWSAHHLFARLFDPERLAALGLSELRADVERIRARLAGALAALTDETARAQQLALLAEQGLDQLRFDAAIELYHHAARLAPDDPRYPARLAWLLYHHPSRARAQVIGSVRREMARTLKLAPAAPEPYTWLGEIYLADRKHEQAIECFRWALALQGGCRAAERGLRLATLRQSERCEWTQPGVRADG
ncbi:MAG TPA: hypothetical protein VKN99_13505 [Polyangia bacterium]|nr:hypothetical protein [Polyangia bacterium]